MHIDRIKSLVSTISNPTVPVRQTMTGNSRTRFRFLDSRNQQHSATKSSLSSDPQALSLHQRGRKIKLKHAYASLVKQYQKV